MNNLTGSELRHYLELLGVTVREFVVNWCQLRDDVPSAEYVYQMRATDGVFSDKTSQALLAVLMWAAEKRGDDALELEQLLNERRDTDGRSDAGATESDD